MECLYIGLIGFVTGAVSAVVVVDWWMDYSGYWSIPDHEAPEE